MEAGMNFSRVWAMPNSSTFDIPVVGAFVRKYLKDSKLSIDPFARNQRLATSTNDLDPATSAQEHLEARTYLSNLVAGEVYADLVLFDPPYSPRQISRNYLRSGIKANQRDTQNSVLYAECRDLLFKLTRPGAIVLSFGWNSAGMGKGRRFEILEIMLVCHGGAHNDLICMAERRLPSL